MVLKQCILLNNDCYKQNMKITNGKPTGIVVHSTGANNPYLKRYVQPLMTQANYNDVINDIGLNTNKNDWNRNTGVCVHAFIGKNANERVETYQTLPFDICCFGCGSGSKGSYNYNPTARIQFEICEDNLANETYFNLVMREAQEFCAYLCTEFGFGVEKISSHHESYLQKYGTNHADIDHWLVKFGKNMDWFRLEVQKLLNKNASSTPVASVAQAALNAANNNEKICYEFLTKKMGCNNAVAAGILASIDAESSFMPNNLQNTSEKSLNMTDDEYVKRVDNGTYTNFVNDKAGFGIFQWTFSSRKQEFLKFIKKLGTSIGDLNAQLEFFAREIMSDTAIFNKLKSLPNTLNSAYQAGYIVCHDYEAPAEIETQSVKRGNAAKEYFKKYSKTVTYDEPQVVVNNIINVGDVVKLSADATVYGNGNKFAPFIYNSTLYVRELVGSRAVISTQKTGAVTGAVDVKYLIKV